jgi:glycosyltransferase involved in cell wall biosynthesis
MGGQRPKIRASEQRQETLTVAVPNLGGHHPQTGIGRVLHSLRHEWREHVELVEATFNASRLPVLRNMPTGVRVPDGTDIVLLPQLTGAQALQSTSGIPSLAVVHDVGIVDCPADRQGVNWISRQSVVRSFDGLRSASHIVTVSRFTRRRLLDYLPDITERVSTIPDGVGDLFLDYDQPQRIAREKLADAISRPLGVPLLIYVGSEQPRKNIRLLLEAFCQLRPAYRRAQLLKVGRAGHPRWRAQTLAIAEELGIRLGQDLLVLEDIDDDTLAHAYQAADVFVSSSLYEGFGLPVLEAMAVGTPVVVTRRGAHSEVVGDVGWLAEPEPNAFAEAIVSALQDADREQRIARGRARAATYTWSATAEAYLELMHRLVNPLGQGATPIAD